MTRKSHRTRSRPSKMGEKWIQDDLLAYNIRIVYQDLETFFGVTDLPPPDALTAQAVARTGKSYSKELLANSNRSADRPDNTESYTVGFVSQLFSDLLDANVMRGDGYPMMFHPLRYLGALGSPPYLDFCLRNRTRRVILVVKVVRPSRGFEPEPRIIGDAVAAFHNDNLGRIRANADPVTEKVMMPGIIVDGTMPSFYKIPITPELVAAVGSGERPEEETIVHAYRPEVPKPGEGMGASENCSIILPCLEAFIRFL